MTGMDTPIESRAVRHDRLLPWPYRLAGGVLTIVLLLWWCIRPPRERF